MLDLVMKKSLRPLTLIPCQDETSEDPSICSNDKLFIAAVRQLLKSDMEHLREMHCQGCSINHPSQIMHSHLTVGHSEMMALYFERVFASFIGNKNSVNRVWAKLKDRFCEDEHSLHKTKYCCLDWFQSFTLQCKDIIEADLQE